MPEVAHSDCRVDEDEQREPGEEVAHRFEDVAACYFTAEEHNQQDEVNYNEESVLYYS